MTDYYEGLNVLGISLPERALKILEAEAERLGFIYHGKGSLRPLMLHYATMYKDHPEERKVFRAPVPRRWGGRRRDKQIWLPSWARTLLRMWARSKGLVNRMKNGDVNALLQDHAAYLAKEIDSLPTVDEWRIENTPLP